MCPVGAPERPGIVHRLDKETSGLMVVAKKESAYHSLVKQFSDREVLKRYKALVMGKMKIHAGTFNESVEGIPKFVLKCPWSLTENLQLRSGGYWNHSNRGYALLIVKLKLGEPIKYVFIFRMPDIPLLVMKPMATRLAGIRINSKIILRGLCCMRRY